MRAQRTTASTAPVIADTTYVAASDGVRLHLRRWLAGRDERAVLVYLHGIASHSGWFEETAIDLAGRGISVLAPDRRGSGRSDGPRGHLGRYERALLDVDEVVSIAVRHSEGSPLFLAGSSWAAKLAVLYAASQRERLSGLLLLGPGLLPRVTLPAWRQVQVVVSHSIFPTARIPIPLTPEMYTTEPRYVGFIRADRLRLLTATSRFFWETVRLDRRRAAASKRLRLPLVVLQGEDDVMMDVPGTAAWVSRLAIDDKTYTAYPAAGHTMEFASQRRRYVDDLAGWILDRSSTGSVSREGQG